MPAGVSPDGYPRGTHERAPDLTGLSCLADGADQIFARAVTDLGGTLEAVIPAAEYRERLPADSHPGYDDLFARAAAVHRLPFTACRSPAVLPIPGTSSPEHFQDNLAGATIDLEPAEVLAITRLIPEHTAAGHPA